MTEDTQIRKPRLALLGEFSAGKSTLTNALLGQATAHVQVTATQMPPVWYSHGTGAPVRVDLNGEEHVLDGDALSQVSPADTRALRVYVDAPLLEKLDLIDMPGSSDPNMASDAWDALMPEFDAVIWCTPATQAWRQSEAAIWENVPGRLYRRSALLLTRIDKIASGKDRDRVVGRMVRETEDQFVAVLPVALREALEAAPGSEAWASSGIADVLQMIDRLAADAPEVATAPRRVEPSGDATPDRTAIRLDGSKPRAVSAPDPGGLHVMPRRVVGRIRRSARPHIGDGPMV
ncbi:dynamin family protein [Gymnodinialimonas sp. 2305UL16-5]|uniref:dynamin family protein n=1 Tax=Gymnodinialimonas mytili TaxID=3126503 RepID=UPI0030B74E27